MAVLSVPLFATTSTGPATSAGAAIVHVVAVGQETPVAGFEPNENVNLSFRASPLTVTAPPTSGPLLGTIFEMTGPLKVNATVAGTRHGVATLEQILRVAFFSPPLAGLSSTLTVQLCLASRVPAGRVPPVLQLLKLIENSEEPERVTELIVRSAFPVFVTVTSRSRDEPPEVSLKSMLAGE